MDYFVSAIGTDSGKTLVSAILTEALEADYWKPVQSGEPRDTRTVEALVSNEHSVFWKESYFLNTPASPHASAKIDGIEIDLYKIKRPATSNHLIIEGAGGLLVPLNDSDCVADIAVKLKVPVILVCNLYLGSINHSLLSIYYLKKQNIEVKGIIFSGPENQESERIIEEKSPWPTLLKIPQLAEVNKEVVRKYATKLKQVL
jgi:dethiobiotin synthetase